MDELFVDCILNIEVSVLHSWNVINRLLFHSVRCGSRSEAGRVMPSLRMRWLIHEWSAIAAWLLYSCLKVSRQGDSSIVVWLLRIGWKVLIEAARRGRGLDSVTCKYCAGFLSFAMFFFGLPYFPLVEIGSCQLPLKLTVSGDIQTTPTFEACSLRLSSKGRKLLLHLNLYLPLVGHFVISSRVTDDLLWFSRIIALVVGSS